MDCCCCIACRLRTACATVGSRGSLWCGKRPLPPTGPLLWEDGLLWLLMFRHLWKYAKKILVYES